MWCFMFSEYFMYICVFEFYYSMNFHIIKVGRRGIPFALHSLTQKKWCPESERFFYFVLYHALYSTYDT